MGLAEDLLPGVLSELRTRGYAHVRLPLELDAYLVLASALGDVVGEERFALRPGAHAYVARPDPVPMHTDQPEVQVIGWWCERQDDLDGASLLLDSSPVTEALPIELRDRLREVHLVTPPLHGGPPTMQWPVLRRHGDSDAIFCSPWLRSALPIPEHERALDSFRERLSATILKDRISIRLGRGEALFVDNTRVLHGRDAIAPGSRRALHRRWMAGAPVAA
ncbi:MAG TPA: TauD/TfdA family dioxygenase [Polyangiaceae bacterium]|jgi:hypothetical protein